MSEINARQKKFADEYIISGIAEKAALNAGYSKNYARSQAHNLLANVGIQKYIEEQNKKIESSKIASMQEIKEFWTSTLYEVEHEIRDRMRASELLAKSHGGFIEKVEHSGAIDISNKSDVINKYLKSDADDS